jgi:hypothetical protein
MITFLVKASLLAHPEIRKVAIAVVKDIKAGVTYTKRTARD